VGCSTSKQAGLIIGALSACLMAAPAVNSAKESEADAQGAASVSEESNASDPKNPPPVKPSREARSRGLELSLFIGLGVMASASYAYDTRVSLPGTDQLQYSGVQRSPGVALFAGGALTLPGAFRRITVGAGINVGGPDSNHHPVIPNGVSTPFLKQNLYFDIQTRRSNWPGWSMVFSPFLEHDIGFFHGSRLRAGYQYWNQLGSLSGSFAPADGSSMAKYNVRLSLRSHLFRLTVNDYVALEDDGETLHRPKRRAGMIQQWGIMVGTHQSIVVFVALGPFWQIAR
jgi:hypothetical protein